MKIGIACFKFKRGGGTERYVLDLIQGFSHKNIKPTLYSTYFDRSLPEYELITPKSTSLSFIPKKLRLPFLSNFIYKNREINEVILSVAHTYADIVICGGQHKGYLNSLNKRPSLLERFKIWNEKKCFLQAKKVLAHSQLMKKELIEFYNIPEHKIDVIYPPVDTQKFKQIDALSRQKLRDKLGFKPNEIIYLFPSTGHKRKGFYFLKDFFEKTELPIKLVVAGTPIPASKNIISLGFRNDMPELYQAADYTIMASNYEPFGLVGIESILSGTPIMFSENMACLEVLQENFGFTFSKDSPSSLNEAILKSIQKVEMGGSRILEPYKCIAYDPSLIHHIESIEKLIWNSKA